MLTLTKITETSSTITLGWTPPAGISGYVLYANGQVASVATANLKDGTPRKEAKFSKASPGPPYEVAAVVRRSGVVSLELGKYPTDAPLPSNVARSEPTLVTS